MNSKLLERRFERFLEEKKVNAPTVVLATELKLIIEEAQNLLKSIEKN